MKLVLLDLDNTLIDADYRLTVPEDELRTVIRELAQKDVHVGLCSDSAVVTLRQWAERLGLTGPIVAERGAVVWDSVQHIENILDVPGTAWFREFRESFVGALMRNFPGATTVIGDATKFVKDRRISAALAQEVFAINGFRVASFSFFACRPNNDYSALHPDPDLLALASTLAEETAMAHGHRKSDLFWDENSQSGILIMHARTTEKRYGVSMMIDRLKPEQTVMIGDSMSDFLGLPHVAQYAVGNADVRYKATSDFVADHSLTEGVIECLLRFM